MRDVSVFINGDKIGTIVGDFDLDITPGCDSCEWAGVLGCLRAHANPQPCALRETVWKQDPVLAAFQDGGVTFTTEITYWDEDLWRWMIREIDDET